MRWLINYIRSLSCSHEFDMIGKVSTYSDDSETRPYKTVLTYRCKKCGFIQRVKL